MKKRGTLICCVASYTISAICFAVAAVVLILVVTGSLQRAVDNYVQQKLVLKEGNTLYDQWVDPSVPMYKDFYMYNLTNPYEFGNGSKPRFQEIGPYRYREYRKKTVFNSSDGKIFFVMNRTFHFEQTSNLTEQDMVTTINFALVTAIAMVGDSFIMKTVLKGIIDTTKAQLTITAPVHNLIWNYTDDFLQELYALKDFTHLTSPYITLNVNNSEMDRTNLSIVYSGETDTKLTAQYIQWDGNKTLEIWQGYARMLNGTEGLVYHSFIKQDEILIAFIEDALRSFHLYSNETVSVRGIHTYRYRVPEYEFLPNPDYLNFDAPRGLIYLGPTQHPPAPVYGSKPHFLDGDPSLLEAVEGLSPPDRETQDIVADVEPITGIALNVHEQLQINFNVTQSNDFKEVAKVTPLYFPMLYLDEHATIDEETKSELNSMVFVPLKAINVSVWVLFALSCVIGVLMLIIAINRTIRLCQSSKRFDHLPLINNAADDEK